MLSLLPASPYCWAPMPSPPSVCGLVDLQARGVMQSHFQSTHVFWLHCRSQSWAGQCSCCRHSCETAARYICKNSLSAPSPPSHTPHTSYDLDPVSCTPPVSYIPAFPTPLSCTDSAGPADKAEPGRGRSKRGGAGGQCCGQRVYAAGAGMNEVWEGALRGAEQAASVAANECMQLEQV